MIFIILCVVTIYHKFVREINLKNLG